MEQLNDEQSKYERGNLARECPIFSSESLSLRALIDSIGSVVVIDEDIILVE